MILSSQMDFIEKQNTNLRHMVDIWMTEKINNVVYEDSIDFDLEYWRMVKKKGEMDDSFKMEKI